MARLEADVTGKGLARADVVIEAVVENLEIKRKIFAEAELRTKPGAILATNTSSIELERIAENMQPRLSYLQDAMLGLINAAQTNVLKALSLATIAFVPPTLIASIFGMNFDAMDWFHEGWGPWVAIAMMLLAPAALFTIAKWRRWF